MLDQESIPLDSRLWSLFPVYINNICIIDVNVINRYYLGGQSPLFSELHNIHAGHVPAMAQFSAYGKLQPHSHFHSVMFWGYMFCNVMKGSYASMMAYITEVNLKFPLSSLNRECYCILWLFHHIKSKLSLRQVVTLQAVMVRGIATFMVCRCHSVGHRLHTILLMHRVPLSTLYFCVHNILSCPCALCPLQHITQSIPATRSNSLAIPIPVVNTHTQTISSTGQLSKELNYVSTIVTHY